MSACNRAPGAPSNAIAAIVEQDFERVPGGGGASVWLSTDNGQSAVPLSLTVTLPSGPTESGSQLDFPGTQRASSDGVTWREKAIGFCH
jgi:hypothetical protein